MPKEPSDYGPLSMLETLYKIPSRILAHRKTDTLTDILSSNQHGFVPGRGIQEPILMATHVLQDAERTGNSLQFISFDLEKAFDKTGNTVIKQALEAFGFPLVLIEAIQRLALQGEGFVEVNGVWGDLFAILTGTGQGDPLSSSNFVIAGQALNLALQKVINTLMYKTLNGERAGIGTNLFADDNLAAMNMTTDNDFRQIMLTYDRFEMVSGLNVNLAKSQILCINTDPNLIIHLEQMGVKIVQKMKYLGI